LPADLEQELERARQAASRYRFPFADLRHSKLDPELLRSIPLDLMVRYEFLPLEAENGYLTVAVGDPTNLERLDELETKLGRKLRVQVAAPSQVREALKNTEPSRRVLDEATEDFRLDVIREE
jgi:type IV pilus assembly protein PilB